MTLEDGIKQLTDAGLTIRGTSILCEMLPEPELKTAGGLIIASDPGQTRGQSVEAHKLLAAKVLAVGPGSYVEDQDKYIPLDIKPGQVVILNQYSYSLVSKLPGLRAPTANKLAITPASGIFAVYPSLEAYQQALG